MLTKVACHYNSLTVLERSR